MENTFKSRLKKILSIAGIFIILLGIIYGFYCSYRSYKKLQIARNDLTSSANNKIKELENDLAVSKQENANITAILTDAQKQNLDLQNEQTIAQNQINTLTKLTTIDPELLKKYSKVYFLNENYIPANLVDIDSVYLINSKNNLQILDKVDPYLENMLEDANDNNVPLRVVSAYRSFATQKALKSGYKMIYGAGTANQFSADQGYSEHQLGTALDFTTPTIKGPYPSFSKSTAYAWLNANAYKYGFIISYPKENTYYEYESWHWRFVGKELATYIHDNNTYFYKLDQRFIDTYLIKIFD